MSRRKNIIRSIMNRVRLKSQGCIAGLDKSCGLSSIQHATGLPDHVVARAAIMESKHPVTPYKKDDGVHNETRGRILARLGYSHEELPARFKSFIHRTFSGRTITAKKRETAAEVAKRHPDKNLIVHAMSGAGPLHAFNIKYGKIYDRHGMAHPDDPVSKIFHVRKLNQEEYIIENKVDFPLKRVTNDTIAYHHHQIASEHNNKSEKYEKMSRIANKKGNKTLAHIYNKLSGYHFAAGMMHGMTKDLYLNPYTTEDEANRYSNKAHKVSKKANSRELRILDNIKRSKFIHHHNMIKREVERNS